MELKRLKIDEEFRHLIRPLRHREFLQLEQNIINDGFFELMCLIYDHKATLAQQRGDGHRSLSFGT